MKKFNFTIVELLVVIAIILILVGMLFPAVSKVKERAKITRAKGEMTALYIAIKQYETNYGFLPSNLSVSGTPNGYHNANSASPASKDAQTFTTRAALNATESSNSDKYRVLMEYLTCVNGPLTANSSFTASNPRKIRFLDSPVNYGNYTDQISDSTTGARKGDIQDPWGNLYQIFVDKNYDGVIDCKNGSSTADYPLISSTNFYINDTNKCKDEKFNGSVLIYSLGPNRINDGGKNSQFGEGSGKDDVCQWR